jgi:N-glycosylase/DNA lyase
LLHRIDLNGEPLNLDYTFGCGQIFQWRQVDGWWLGQVENHATLLKVDGGSLLFRSDGGLKETRLRAFLGLNVPQGEIFQMRRLDDFSVSLLRDYRGLRVLRQDPWICLVSYMISASLSIRAIDKIMERIAFHGEELQVEGHQMKSFPGPQEFAGMERPLEGYLGRRWEYLKGAANGVNTGAMDFEKLRRSRYEEAWESLVTSKEGHIQGVGPKVADCTMLFSLDKPEAFPMDRWIMRGLARHYSWLLPEPIAAKLGKGGGSLTCKEYAAVSRNLRSYFGEAGGLVQECLFLHMRTAAPRRPSA